MLFSDAFSLVGCVNNSASLKSGMYVPSNSEGKQELDTIQIDVENDSCNFNSGSILGEVKIEERKLKCTSDNTVLVFDIVDDATLEFNQDNSIYDIDHHGFLKDGNRFVLSSE